MIRKALMAALLAFQPYKTAAASVPVPLEPSVPRVYCPQDDGGPYYATAFRISPHLLLSVKHVTSLAHCEIDGVPIHILYTSPTADFTILSDDRAGKWLTVDCEGFIAGRKYIAIGHPRAVDSVVAVPLIGTGNYSDDGEAVLVGVFTVQPGHSGGAIIDAVTHQVVGTINAANWEEGTSYSVELKKTPICTRNIA